MMLLIITADDAGYSETRDRGILEMARQNFVTDASVIVNGESFESFLVKWKNDGLTIPGIHLNITEGSPLLGPDAVPSLVNAKGLMLKKEEFLERLTRGLIDLKEVEAEIRAQVNRFITVAGAPPSHFIGHQHIHIMPGVTEVCASVMAGYGILRTRHPVEDLNGVDIPSSSFLTKVAAMSRDAAPIYQRYRIAFPPLFVGLSTMGSSMTLERLNYCFTSAVRTGPGPCEFMVHPGYRCLPNDRGCGGGVDDFSRLPDREHEMEVLASEDLSQLLKSLNLKRANFVTALPS